MDQQWAEGEGGERGAEAACQVSVLESKLWYTSLFVFREKDCASCISVIQGPPW